MSQFVDGPYKTFTAGTDLEPFRLCKLSSGGTIVGYTSLGDVPLGMTTHRVTSGSPVTVKLFAGSGTFKIAAEANVTAGSSCQASYNGYLALGSGTGPMLSLEDSGASGVMVEAVKKL
jgi:hypothetical protein